MLARTTESVLVEPDNSSRGGTYDQEHKHPLQDAETSEYQQNGIPGEYWTGHERVGEGQIRCDDFRGGDQCPRVAEETATYRQPHSDDGQTFRKFTQGKTPFAATRPCKSSSSTLWWQKTRSSRMQRPTRHSWPSSTRNRLGYSSSTGDILLGAMCHYFPEFGKHGGHFLPRSHRVFQGWKRRIPPRSRVVHMDSADSGIFAAGTPEHGRLPAVDGDVLFQARSHCPFREETSKFLYRESAPVIKCFFTQKTGR